jgi:hypothetical protein
VPARRLRDFTAKCAIPLGQLAQQRWIIDRQHLTRRRLDIQREVGRVGTDGVEDGREGLGFRQVGGKAALSGWRKRGR